MVSLPQVVGGILGVGLVGYFLMRGGFDRTPVTVAHIGNSFQFVNDFPRTLQTMSSDRIAFQDSCLHGSLGFYSLLKKGNGLVHRWNTSNAWNEKLGLHDLGACTISQLLLGQDDYLSSYTYEEQYTIDGKNPCFHDIGNDDDQNAYEWWDDSQEYLEYSLTAKTRSSWDFIVLNDQSMQPARSNAQSRNLKSLINSYLPMFLESGATPIFIVTHGYWRTDISMSDYGLTTVPIFTAKLYQGYQSYVQELTDLMPYAQRPRLAPVGVAFLVIWEENPKFWPKLFGNDNFHPSPHGTYLMACVVHATMFRYMPKASFNKNPSEVFERSRSMQLGNYSLPMVNEDEADYLRWIAKRVALRNYRPASFLDALDAIKDEYD